MVSFFKKKGEGDGGVDTSGDGGVEFTPDPEKARVWFNHARTAADAYNHGYALHCYASGLKFDPEALSAHEKIFESAIAYAQKEGKPAKGSEVKAIDGPGLVDKMAAAEFEWMKDINNLKLALKFLDASAEAGHPQVGLMFAPRVILIVRKQKKISKSLLNSARDTFAAVGAWDQAVQLAEAALNLDPNNADLEAELKDLIAQRAMDQAGYNDDSTGQEGGFKRFVKDMDKQKELEAEDQMSGAGGSADRTLAKLKDEFEKNPGLPDALNRYAAALRKQGTPESRAEAKRIYLKGYEEIGEYRFKMNADDIDIAALEAQVEAVQSKLEDDPDNEALQSELAEKRQAWLERKRPAYAERVKTYPTDRHLKYELGRVLFELGEYDEAMDAFQKSKDEPKLRARAGHYLGQCFEADGWHSEAISEFREALENLEASERERALEINYDLMNALMAHAKQEQDLDIAKEAQEICSGIVRKNISYRDIRQKRREIDEIIKGLG